MILQEILVPFVFQGGKCVFLGFLKKKKTHLPSISLQEHQWITGQLGIRSEQSGEKTWTSLLHFRRHLARG